MNKLDISVLLVEDDRLSKVLYSNFLSKIVEKVYLAKNGVEGIEQFNEFQPDLVLSDIKMPKMDGLEMAKKIREIDESVKIILVSGHQETDYFIKSIELGIAGYLLKPIEQEKRKQNPLPRHRLSAGHAHIVGRGVRGIPQRRAADPPALVRAERLGHVVEVLALGVD